MRIEIKPFLISVLLFILLNGAYLTLVAFARWAQGVVVWLPYVAVLVCGGVTGYMSSFKPLLSAAILGIVLSAGLGLFNFVWSAIGMPSDLSGFNGSAWVAVLSIPYAVALSALGGGIGGWIRQYKKAT